MPRPALLLPAALLMLGNDLPQLPLADLEAADTAALAARLLPPEMAGEPVSHEVLGPHLSMGPPQGVRFFGRPHAVGAHLCGRVLFRVALTWASNEDEEPVVDLLQVAAPPEAHDQIAFGARCEDGAALRYAEVQGATTTQAAALLQSLTAAQATAKAGRTPPMPVRCQSDLAMTACDPDPAAVLARLPLAEMVSVEGPERAGGPWRVMIVDGPDGAPVWMVDMDGPPEAPGAISLHRTMRS